MFTIYGLYDAADPGAIRYIGKTANLRERVQSHVGTARRQKRGSRTYNAKWIRSVLRAGRRIESVLITMAETQDEANRLETQTIAAYRAAGHRLTNLTAGGEGAVGCVPSEETRLKLSKASKGRPSYTRTPEQRAALSARLRGRKNGPHSAETRAKIGAGNIGKHVGRKRTFSETHRRNLSLAGKGKPKSTESRERMRLAAQHRPPMPAEARRKQSASQKSSPKMQAHMKRLAEMWRQRRAAAEGAVPCESNC